MRSENEYVLGTHDREIARLGLQHRAWRARALEAWQSAEIRPGHTVLDVGCGPGYASLDLAEALGPQGRVVAIDKSERFLAALECMDGERGLGNLTLYRADLEAGEFPQVRAHRAWCRWVLSFVKNPREVLAAMTAALEPEGVIVLHEYFDYASWRTSPPCPEVEEFVRAVMTSWREAGGEPDIALQVLRWLEELGLELAPIRPILDVVQPGDLGWAWLRGFVQVGRERLVELGHLSATRAEGIWQAFCSFEAMPHSRMITPAVLEMIARRPR